MTKEHIFAVVKKHLMGTVDGLKEIRTSSRAGR